MSHKHLREFTEPKTGLSHVAKQFQVNIRFDKMPRSKSTEGLWSDDRIGIIKPCVNLRLSDGIRKSSFPFADDFVFKNVLLNNLVNAFAEQNKSHPQLVLLFILYT